MKIMLFAVLTSFSLFLNGMYLINKPLLSTDQLYQVLQLKKEKCKKWPAQLVKPSEEASVFYRADFDQKFEAWCMALIPAWYNQQTWCPIANPAWYDDREDKQDGLPDLERESVPSSRFWHIFAALAEHDGYNPIIEKMLNEGISPIPPKKEFPEQRPDPLYAACRKAAVENVKTLLQHGALANDCMRSYSLIHETDEYVTPIFCTLFEAAKTICEYYNLDTLENDCLRHLSARRYDIIDLLLYFGANPRMPIGYALHPNNILTYVVKHFQADFNTFFMIERLRYAGMNPEKGCLGSPSAIDFAAQRKEPELIAALSKPLEPIQKLSSKRREILFPAGSALEAWSALRKMVYNS